MNMVGSSYWWYKKGPKHPIGPVLDQTLAADEVTQHKMAALHFCTVGKDMAMRWPCCVWAWAFDLVKEEKWRRDFKVAGSDQVFEVWLFCACTCNTWSWFWETLSTQKENYSCRCVFSPVTYQAAGMRVTVKFYAAVKHFTPTNIKMKFHLESSRSVNEHLLLWSEFGIWFFGSRKPN